MIGGFDLGNPEEFESFFTIFDEEGWPPIRGIIHAAGRVMDSMLSDLNSELFGVVTRPKVVGGWLLLTLKERYPLDFFIAYSSAAAIMASPGGANYSAANAFLDSLVHHKSMRQS